ncbi:MAG: META domain-containing protein [Paracoccaceae bacterium]
MIRTILFRAGAPVVAALLMILPAEAREVKGALAYRERIALPEGAEILLEVREGDRVIAAFRAETKGAQVPLPFALDIPEGQGQALTGALKVAGQVRWVSQPQALAAGPVDLGIVALTAYEPAPTHTLTLPFVARGNEPGWVLNATSDGVAFSREDGGAQGGPLPQGEDNEAGTRYAVSPDLAFTVSEAICRDTMTGMPYPATVLVEQAGAVLNGCGGDPAALLSGDWRVTRIGETDVPAGVEVTMAFDGLRVSGTSGCNRYTGAAEMTGESFRFGPVAGTRMACLGAGADVEQAFLSTLARIDRFDIGDDGGLVLIGGEVPLVAAVR